MTEEKKKSPLKPALTVAQISKRDGTTSNEIVTAMERAVRRHRIPFSLRPSAVCAHRDDLTNRHVTPNDIRNGNYGPAFTAIVEKIKADRASERIKAAAR